MESARLEEALSKFSGTTESITLITKDLSLHCNDNCRFLSLLATCLQQALQKWNQSTDSAEKTELGDFGAILTSKCLQVMFNVMASSKELNRSVVSTEVADKVLKVVSYPLVNGMKLTARIPLLIDIVESASYFFSDETRLVGSNELIAKCCAHYIQLAAQLACKMKPDSSEHVQRLGQCLLASTSPVSLSLLSSGSFKAEDSVKLMTYASDAIVSFSFAAFTPDASLLFSNLIASVSIMLFSHNQSSARISDQVHKILSSSFKFSDESTVIRLGAWLGLVLDHFCGCRSGGGTGRTEDVPKWITILSDLSDKAETLGLVEKIDQAITALMSRCCEKVEDCMDRDKEEGRGGRGTAKGRVKVREDKSTGPDNTAGPVLALALQLGCLEQIQLRSGVHGSSMNVEDVESALRRMASISSRITLKELSDATAVELICRCLHSSLRAELNLLEYSRDSAEPTPGAISALLSAVSSSFPADLARDVNPRLTQHWIKLYQNLSTVLLNYVSVHQKSREKSEIHAARIPRLSRTVAGGLLALMAGSVDGWLAVSEAQTMHAVKIMGQLWSIAAAPGGSSQLSSTDFMTEFALNAKRVVTALLNAVKTIDDEDKRHELFQCTTSFAIIIAARLSYFNLYSLSVDLCVPVLMDVEKLFDSAVVTATSSAMGNYFRLRDICCSALAQLCVRTSGQDLRSRGLCAVSPFAQQLMSMGSGGMMTHLLLQTIVDVSIEYMEENPQALTDVVAITEEISKCNSHLRPSLFSSIQDLTVKSKVCWMRGISGYEEQSEFIVEKLKDIARAVDSSAVKLASSSSNRTTTAKVSKKKVVSPPPPVSTSVSDCSAADKFIHECLALRAWALLAAWASPAVWNNGKDGSSGPTSVDVVDSSGKAKMKDSVSISCDGWSGAAVYLTEALKTVRRIAAELIESMPLSNPAALHVIHLMLEDVRSIWYQMGIMGRLKDQEILYQLFGEIAQVVVQRSMLQVSQGWLVLYWELGTQLKMNRVWNNHSFKIEQTASFEALAPESSYCTSDTATVISWMNQCGRAVDVCSAVLGGAKALDMSALETIIQEITSPLRGAHQIHSDKTQQSLKVWVLLLCAKTVSLQGGESKQAFLWTWQAIALLGLSSSHSQMCSMDKLLPRFEAILQVAELYEQTGSLDTATSFIAEAMATAKLGSPALTNLVQLHCVRIWLRTSSSRLLPTIMDLCAQDSSTEGLEYINDDVSRLTQRSALRLSHLLGMSGDESRSSEEHEVVSFRYLNLQWDAETTLSETIVKEDGSYPDIRSHCMISCAMQRNLKEGLNTVYKQWRQTSSLSATPRLSGISPPGQATTASSELETLSGRVLTEISATNCFDHIRNLRRIVCTQVVSSDRQSSSSSAMHAFALCASSCGVSRECQLLKPSSHPQESLDPNILNLIRKCTSGEPAGLTELQDLLQSSGAVFSPGSSGVIVTAVIEPVSNTLILARLENRLSPMVACLPVASQVIDLLQSWDALMERSRNQLLGNSSGGSDHSRVSAAPLSDAEKRVWWEEREDCDHQIAEIVAQIQRVLGPWACMMSPVQSTLNTTDWTTIQRVLSAAGSKHHESKTSKPKKTSSKVLTIDNEHVLKWFQLLVSSSMESELLNEAVDVILSSSDLSAAQVDEIKTSLIRSVNAPTSGSNVSAVPSDSLGEDLTELITELEGLKVTELKSRLKAAGQASTGKKQEMIYRIVASARDASLKNGQDRGLPSHTSSIDSTDQSQLSPQSQVLLLLDERLQSLPWESLPLLRRTPCTRLTSFPILLELIQRQKTKGDAVSHPASARSLNPQKCWFVIDPESNLKHTREVMSAFVEPFARRWNWTGFVSEMPSQVDVRSLHDRSDLFIYCGHGAGEKMIDTHKLRRLKCPSSWLWGCSSGRLTSSGIHDPCGPSLDYLLGGSSHVLANLWDVTDKDIDRLSMKFMSSVIDSTSAGSDGSCVDVSNELSKARDICKLKYAVGSAPVIYGLQMQKRLIP